MEAALEATAAAGLPLSPAAASPPSLPAHT